MRVVRHCQLWREVERGGCGRHREQKAGFSLLRGSFDGRPGALCPLGAAVAPAAAAAAGNATDVLKEAEARVPLLLQVEDLALHRDQLLLEVVALGEGLDELGLELPPLLFLLPWRVEGFDP